MNKIAFFVDGHLEKKFIQRACPNTVVRILNCNGKDVEMSAIAKRVATHCRLLKGKYYPIIVVIDREERTQSATELSDILIDEIRQNDVSDEIIVGVADRMIENWILADEDCFSDMAKRKFRTCSITDGLHGKNQLTHCIGTYHKTTTGVKLLLKCRPSVMKKRNLSFKEFIDKIPEESCWWMSR